MPDSLTCLCGTLKRLGRNLWQWSDGTPEPRVRDLSPDRWNFRCRTDASGTYAEVLWGAALETPALRWIVDQYRAGLYRASASLDHTGPLMIDDAGNLRRMHIEPGTDPLLGNEPLPESPGPIPRVVLVPVADWDAWTAANPEGASWDQAHEPEILAKARALGWRPNP